MQTAKQPLRRFVLALPIAIAACLLLIGAALANGLVITIDDGVATAHPADVLTYTVSVSNSDVLSPAQNVLITGSLPISTAQITSAGGGQEVTPGLVSWGPITVSAGSTLSRTLVARVLNPLPASIKALTTTAALQFANVVSSALDVDPILAAFVGGRVLHDADRNGSAAGDAGLAGVQVRVGLPNSQAITLTTSITGAYRSPALAAGQYTLTVVTSSLPLPMSPVYDPDGGQDSRALVSVTNEQLSDANHFGYALSSAITGTLWHDVNGDGALGIADARLGNVQVTLLDLTNAQLITKTTDASGGYRFDGLAAGGYRVQVVTGTLPSALRLTVDPDGALDSSTLVTLSLATPTASASFGYQLDGSITSTVWHDVNGDGSLGGGDLRLPNVQVTLLNLSNAQLITKTTDISGVYRFNGLAAGAYRVRVITGTLPTGLRQNVDPDGALDSSTVVTLSLAAPNTNTAFGYRLAGSIASTVWHDANGDGIRTEAGLPGVTVRLLNGVGAEIMTRTTDISGTVRFENLLDGLYQVRVLTSTLPSGLTPSFEQDGGLDGLIQVTLAPNQANAIANFGYKLAGRIYGVVWDDINGDGIVGEAGLASVTVQLLDGNGALISSTSTAADGSYQFANLLAGLYRVAVLTTTLPPGLVPTFDRDLNLDAKTEVALAPNQANVQANFGFAVSILIVDNRVWYDSNRNALFDGGDVALANIGIVARRAGVDGLFGTPDDLLNSTQTDVAGLYGFNTAPPGLYQISVLTPTLAPAWRLVFERDGVLDGQYTAGLVTAGSVITNIHYAYSSADLQVQKSDGDATVTTEETVFYTISITNANEFAAGRIVVTETVPANSSFNAAFSTPGWSCDHDAPAGSTCLLEVSSIPTATTSTLIFAVSVADHMPVAVNTITNTVRVRHVDARGLDPSPENNLATDTTPVIAAPQLRLRINDVQADGSIRRVPGDMLIYTLVYQNIGNQDTIGIQLDQVVPNLTVYSASNSTTGWSCADASLPGVSCSLAGGDLQAQETKLVTIGVEIDPVMPFNATQIRADGLMVDAFGNFDGDFSLTPIDASPDLRVTQINRPTVIQPGREIAYTLQYGNTGNRNAIGVLILTSIPRYTTLLDSVGNCTANTYGGNHLASDDVICELAIGSLPVGDGGEAAYRVRVDPQLPDDYGFIGSFARIAGSGSENDIGNNQDVSATEIQLPAWIELEQFVATQISKTIRIDWVTGAEINTFGFRLLRSTGVISDAVAITPNLITAVGGEDIRASYVFTDVSVLENVLYTYWLEETETTGYINLYGPIQGKMKPAGAPLTSDAAVTIIPEKTSVLSYASANITISVAVELSTVFEETVLVFDEIELPAPAPEGYALAGEQVFRLSAYQNNKIQPNPEWRKKLGLSLWYQDADVAELVEKETHLFRWDGEAWGDAADDCSPATSYTRELDTNRVDLPICVVGDFALFAAEYRRIYIPLLIR